jgi:hypothetical protein
MKRNLLLFLILIISFPTLCQNWAPINTNEKFCYTTDDTLDIINNVIWVDSFEQNGDEQVYQLNKIARPIEDEDFQYLFNEPQFLLDQITIQENGEWVCLDTFFTPLDTLETFSLFPNAGLNDSWNFTAELQAEVTEMSLMDILGETDSVKTISLSDNSEIILSKAHGIVNWRNQYQLIGIEGRDLGVLVPDFEDMYANISAGDVICYDVSDWVADETVTGMHSEERYDIISVERYDDSLVLELFFRANTEYWWKGKNLNYINGIQELVLYRNRFTDVYPNDTIFIGAIGSYNYHEGIGISKLTQHKWGGIKKTQFIYDQWWPNSNLFNTCEGIYSFELCQTGDATLVEHSVDFGFLELQYAGFEWGGHKELVGIIDNGDTLGTIYPLEMFVGTNQLSTNSNWLVYPNPANDFFNLRSSKTGNITCQIYNFSGLLVDEQTINKTAEEISISVDGFSSGVYLVKLIQNDQTEVLKFVKE